jgi:hypothetical protein
MESSEQASLQLRVVLKLIGGSDTFSVIECEDGMFAICQNNLPIDKRRWTPARLEAAIIACLEAAGVPNPVNLVFRRSADGSGDVITELA